jgi:tetratricopeptide (TPR) repeat protein
MTTARRRIALAAGAAVLLAGVLAAVFVPGAGRRRSAGLLPYLPDLSAAPASVVAHLTEADRAARRAPDDPEAVGALALDYHADGVAGPALAAYARAEALAPADPRWPYGAALLLSDAGRTEEAVAALGRTLDRDPTHALAAWRLASLLEARGETEEAAAAYRRALKLDAPGSPWALASERDRHPRLTEFALTGLARLALLAGRSEEAESLLATATEAGGALGAAHALQADLLSRQGREVEAAEATRRAEACPPFDEPADPFRLDLLRRCRHPALLAEAGAAAVRLHLLERAEDLLYRAREHRPDDPAIVLALAEVLSRTGRVPEAVALLLRSRQAHPDDALVAERLWKTARACAVEFTTAQRLTEAEGLLVTLVRMWPEDPDLRTVLAEYYEQVRDHVNAILTYREVLKLRVTADVHVHLANLLRAVGYEGEARMSAEAALALDPDNAEMKAFLEKN